MLMAKKLGKNLYVHGFNAGTCERFKISQRLVFIVAENFFGYLCVF